MRICRVALLMLVSASGCSASAAPPEQAPIVVHTIDFPCAEITVVEQDIGPFFSGQGTLVLGHGAYQSIDWEAFVDTDEHVHFEFDGRLSDEQATLLMGSSPYRWSVTTMQSWFDTPTDWRTTFTSKVSIYDVNERTPELLPPLKSKAELQCRIEDMLTSLALGPIFTSLIVESIEEVYPPRQ